MEKQINAIDILEVSYVIADINHSQNERLKYLKSLGFYIECNKKLAEFLDKELRINKNFRFVVDGKLYKFIKSSPNSRILPITSFDPELGLDYLLDSLIDLKDYLNLISVSVEY
jgi:hypothetical protein